MLEFKEVTYSYRTTLVRDMEEIRTTEGDAIIHYSRGYYWHPLTALPGAPNIPWHFLKEDSTLYLMREEPNFYV